MRLIDCDALKKDWSMADRCEDCPQKVIACQYDQVFTRMDICQMLDDAPTVCVWTSVKDRLPEEKGEYLVAYHPCHWDVVRYNVTHIGLDSFLGKTAWAKRKYQRVTHWMPLPEAPHDAP